MDKFHVSMRARKLFVRIFRGGGGGTFLASGGRPHGAQSVIWYSILGVAVHADAAVCEFVLDGNFERGDWIDSGVRVFHDSGFCAGAGATKVGTISGTFLGWRLGWGIGAALLGKLADATSIRFVYHVCSFLLRWGF